MSINHLDIEKSVATFVSLSVGDLLADIPSQSGTKPAVVLARQFSKGSRKRVPKLPDSPYCSISYNRTMDDNGAEILATELTATGQVYRTHKLVSINVKFVGNRENTVDDICNRCHMFCEVEAYQDLLRVNSQQELELREKSDILPVNISMNDKYQEIRSFDLIFSVVDEVTMNLDSSGYFDTITTSEV